MPGWETTSAAKYYKDDTKHRKQASDEKTQEPR